MSNLTWEDRHAIADLPVRYARCVDRRDLHGVAECFTRDADYDTSIIPGGMVHQGRDAVVSLVAKAIAGLGSTQHFISNVLVDDHGAGVACHSYVLASHASETGDVTLVGVMQEDEVVCTADGWKIRRRAIQPLWKTVGSAVPSPIPSTGSPRSGQHGR